VKDKNTVFDIELASEPSYYMAATTEVSKDNFLNYKNPTDFNGKI
jgi:hypothetical protein